MGYDFDGTVTKRSFVNPNLKIPSFFFIFLFPLTLFAGKNRKVVQSIKELKAGGFDVIIVSNRPPWNWLKWLMVLQLKLFHISFNLDQIFLVNFGKGSERRKLEILRKGEVDLFFDDDERVVAFLRENFIETIQIGAKGQ